MFFRFLVENNMIEEINTRRLNKVKNNVPSILEYSIPPNNYNYSKTHKYNTLFSRALMGVNKLKLKIEDYIDTDNEKSLKICDLEETNNTIIDCKLYNFLKTINKILKDGHQKLLTSLEFKGHTFTEMNSSPCSNDYFNVNSMFIPDCVIKLMVCTRCNNLPTNEILAKSKSNILASAKCDVCDSNQNDSLMHRLNGFICKFSLYTKRHNYICKIISEVMKDKHGRRNAPPIHENCTLTWLNKEELSDDLKRLKPDLWFGVESNGNLEIHIIEVNCPYGGYTMVNGSKKSKLEIRRSQKIEKYTPLVSEIERRWSARVHLHVIIVSSLGVVPKDTMKKLKTLLGNKRKMILTAKRLSAATLIGSYNVFDNKDLKPTLYFHDSEHVTQDVMEESNEGNVDDNDNDVTYVSLPLSQPEDLVSEASIATFSDIIRGFQKRMKV